MKSRKKLLALISIGVFLGTLSLYLVMFGPVLDDKEFDSALAWAQMSGMPEFETTRDYPFSTISRAQAVGRYVRFAQYAEKSPIRSECRFRDIRDQPKDIQATIILACQYGFFTGSSGTFEPNAYLTKGTSLVALMKGMFPEKDFEQVKEYWIPYMKEANRLGITQREPGPYANYLVTRYELLLQLRRAYQYEQRNK